MKRLLIAVFFVIASVSIFAVTSKSSKKLVCPKGQPTCCLKKQAPAKVKTDYIFWEPVNRLMMIR